jgi:hypothetical protein
MADLRLDRQEAELGYLPPACMRCGAPAVCWRQRDFKKSGVSQETKSWVIAPLCAAHKNHWLLRGLAVPLAFVTWLILSCAGSITAGREQAGIAMLVSGVVFVLWIALAAFLHYTSIHARQITATDLVLGGVAPEFIEALEQHRRSSPNQQPAFLAGALARNQVRLTSAEIQNLPAVCMCCGAPATEWRERAYVVRDGLLDVSNFLGMLFALVVLLDAGTTGVGWIGYRRKGRYVQVRVPLCQRHRNHWSRKPLLIVGSGLLLAALFSGALLLVSRDVAGWVCMAAFAAGIVWCWMAIRVNETGIQPLEVRPEALTLSGVSEGFVQAVEQQRQGSR